jgi:uncharacterized RDD family membrane protein YckC
MTDPTRVVWRRCGAYAAELLLIAVVLFVTLLVAGDVHRSKAGCPQQLPSGRECVQYRSVGYIMRDRAFVWFGVALVVLAVLVFVVPQAVWGSSPGKALFGIRVARRDGSPPGLVRSCVRLASWAVDGLAIGLPIALWLVIFTPRHRRVGDYLAGTYVIRRSAPSPFPG